MECRVYAEDPARGVAVAPELGLRACRAHCTTALQFCWSRRAQPGPSPRGRLPSVHKSLPPCTPTPTPPPGFLPSIGRLLRYVEPAGPNVRCDSGVQEGSEISVHYDPLVRRGCRLCAALVPGCLLAAAPYLMPPHPASVSSCAWLIPLLTCNMAASDKHPTSNSTPTPLDPQPTSIPHPWPLQISKLVTRGVDRPSTLAAMRRALDSYVIRGVQHNAPLLRSVLDIAAFEAGHLSTAFLAGERSLQGWGDRGCGLCGGSSSSQQCIRHCGPGGVASIQSGVRLVFICQAGEHARPPPPLPPQSTSPPPSRRRPTACR